MKKAFLKNIVPDWRFKKITDIAAEFFSDAQLIVLDLDNTLVFSGTKTTTPEIVEWVAALNKQYPCVIFSNSLDFSQRAPEIEKLFGVELFLSKPGVPKLLRPRKPFRRLFLQLQKKYPVDPKKIFVVGDRVFTDVVFGNTNNAKTVLVEPINSRENIFIGMVRKIENGLLSLYN